MSSSVLCLAAISHSAGVVARGLGRSYGDAAQCTGGRTLDITGLNHVGTVDVVAKTIDVAGGVSLHELMRSLIPAGWFVPVTPGTRYVTIGGAIAADVHGKNHHRDGSFANHVVEMTLVTPSGVINVSPDRDPELFWATAGGMGLTGVVVNAKLRLIQIATSWMLVDCQRFSRLSDSDVDHGVGRTISYRYSVAWLDCTRRAQRHPALGAHDGGACTLRCHSRSASGPGVGRRPSTQPSVFHGVLPAAS